MARDPGSVWAPLPEAGAPDGYEKTQFIVHSTGDNGTAAGTRRYFSGATPNESTFIVGWGPHDPTLQIMDSTDRADANMSASIRGISVEVVGDGVGGYNAWQRSELIRLGRWARQVHPRILPRVIPAHDQPGCGWHVMFGAPGPWAGVAKSCPGKQRIAELKSDIFPVIFGGTPQQEDDMYGPEQRYEVVSALTEITGNTRSTNSAVAGMAVQLAQVAAAVQQRPVDVKALAAELAPVLVPAVVSAVSVKASLTDEDVEDAIRRVLGSLDGVSAA